MEMDRISELLFSDEEMPDVYSSLMENDVGTIKPYTPTNAEKRVEGLASLLQKMGGLNLPFDFGSSFEENPRNAYQTAQNILQTIDPYQQGGVGEYLPGFSMDLARERNDRLGEVLSYLDFIPGGAGLKAMAIPAKSAINVGRQRFMLPVNEIARTDVTRSGAPKVTKEALKRQDTINDAYQTANPAPTLATMYQKALDQIRKSEDLIRDTIGMKNPTGQIKQADAMKAAALKEIERIRKAGNGKLPDLMPDKLTTEQIQKAMLDEGLGSLKT